MTPRNALALSMLAAVVAFVFFSSRHAAPLTAAPVDIDASPLPSTFTATDKRIHYIGRFDLTGPDGPRCAWPMSSVEIRFHGTGANVVINEEGEDRYEVVVDGAPQAVLPVRDGRHVYSIASNLPSANHTISLIKRTEASFGRTQFVEVQLASGDRLENAPRLARRRIEAIGDSITAALGNEGTSQAHATIDTENAYLSYGAIASRFLKADYQCIAWSGKKLWPDNDMPSIAGLTLPRDDSTRWHDAEWRPDVIVINLGSNDFYPDNPDKKGWVNAAVAFVKTLRVDDPHAMIYLGLGPMMSDSDPPGHHALATLRDYLQTVVNERRALGDKRIRLLEFQQEDPVTGVGADQHPNIKTHEEMAERLVAAIEADLHWR